MKFLKALLIFPFFLFASQKIDFSQVKEGDFIALKAGKMTTLLAFRQSHEECLVVEEISFPSELKEKFAWSEWIKKGAPGHTCWSIMEIDIKKGEVQDFYSFSKAAWVELGDKESLIANLLKLPFELVLEKDRKKIGPPPQDSEIDVRKIWHPPLVYQGQKIEGAYLKAYSATWPEDGTELSNKTITIYLDSQKRSPLPYYLQVETDHITASFQAVDSGRDLPFIHKNMPRKPPEFLGQSQKRENQIHIPLRLPSRYKNFDLFAIEESSHKKIIPIDFQLKHIEKNKFEALVEEENFKNCIDSSKFYTWLLVPNFSQDYQHLSLQSYKWKGSDFIK